jgi:hypothetical protein
MAPLLIHGMHCLDSVTKAHSHEHGLLGVFGEIAHRQVRIAQILCTAIRCLHEAAHNRVEERPEAVDADGPAVAKRHYQLDVRACVQTPDLRTGILLKEVQVSTAVRKRDRVYMYCKS